MVCAFNSLKGDLYYNIWGAQVWNIFIRVIVLYSDCSVDGIAGDGTAQGDCPYDYQVCYADGTCKGINYFSYYQALWDQFYGFKKLSKYVKSWFLFCNRQMPNQLSECLPKWKKMLPLPLWQKFRYAHLWQHLLLRWWIRSMSGCNVLFNRYIFYW